MNLSNPHDWIIRQVESFTSDAIRGLNLPIPPFETIQLGDRYLRIEVTSTTAKTNWVYAGKATQVVDAGNVDTDADELHLKLAKPLLWIPKEFASYKLRVRFPKYFTQATMSVFGFIG